MRIDPRGGRGACADDVDGAGEDRVAIHAQGTQHSCGFIPAEAGEVEGIGPVAAARHVDSAAAVDRDRPRPQGEAMERLNAGLRDGGAGAVGVDAEEDDVANGVGDPRRVEAIRVDRDRLGPGDIPRKDLPVPDDAGDLQVAIEDDGGLDRLRDAPRQEIDRRRARPVVHDEGAAVIPHQGVAESRRSAHVERPQNPIAIEADRACRREGEVETRGVPRGAACDDSAQPVRGGGPAGSVRVDVPGNIGRLRRCRSEEAGGNDQCGDAAGEHFLHLAGLGARGFVHGGGGIFGGVHGRGEGAGLGRGLGRGLGSCRGFSSWGKEMEGVAKCGAPPVKSKKIFNLAN